MTSFVETTTALPVDKTDANPVPPGEETTHISADELNTQAQATMDVRDWLRAAKWYGLDDQASDPAPSGVTPYLWMDTSGRLWRKFAGVNTLVGEQGFPTALDLDFAAQSAATYSTDTTFTIAGNASWAKCNSSQEAAAAAIVASTGLRLQPSNGGNDYNSGATLPSMWLPFSSLVTAGANWAKLRRWRVWAYVSASNEGASYDNAVLAVDTGQNSLSEYYVVKRGYGTSGVGTQILCGPGGVGLTNDLSSLASSSRVMVIEGGLNSMQVFYGTWASGWPAFSSLTPGFAYKCNGAFSMGSLGVRLGAQRVSSGTSLQVDFRAVRVDLEAT